MQIAHYRGSSSLAWSQLSWQRTSTGKNHGWTLSASHRQSSLSVTRGFGIRFLVDRSLRSWAIWLRGKRTSSTALAIMAPTPLTTRRAATDGKSTKGSGPTAVHCLRYLIAVVETIFLHPYDDSYPDGRHVPGGSAWLKPALDEAQVPPAVQRTCVASVMGRFATCFSAIATASSGRIVFVDSRGTLTRSSQWANELHPTPAGFTKIAESA